MKVGTVHAGYLLVLRGAKSHYTEVWKGIRLVPELEEGLKEPLSRLEEKGDDSEKSAYLEEVLSTHASKPSYLMLTFFRSVSPEDVARFRPVEEKLRTTQLPHILQVLDSHYWEDKKVFLLVTEYVQGTTLNRMVAQEGPNGPWGVAAARKLLYALHDCHREGILHGGLRPDSILFIGEGEIKIRGAGILELLGGPMGSRAPRGPGALRFVPKELWEQESGTSEKSDLYSLGMCLYYLLSGTTPIQGNKPSEIYVEVSDLSQPFPSLREKNPHLQACWVEVVDGMIQKDPAQRWGWEKVLARLDQEDASSGGDSPIPPHQDARGVEEMDLEGKAVSSSARTETSQVPARATVKSERERFLESLVSELIEERQALGKAFSEEQQSQNQKALESFQVAREELWNLVEELASRVNDLKQEVQKLSDLPLPQSQELPQLSFSSVYRSESATILCISRRKGALELWLLHWIGHIPREGVSDLRVHLAELAAKTPPAVLLDLGGLEPSESAANLAAGFIAALASKGTLVAVYGSFDELIQKLDERGLSVLQLENLDEQLVLKELLEKGVLHLRLRGRDVYKKLAENLLPLVEQGFQRILVDLQNKALRGDDMEGLLEVFSLAKQRGLWYRLAGVTGEMETVFRIMDLADLQGIAHASVEEALAQLEPPVYLLPIEDLHSCGSPSSTS